jgi:uncharacterized protein (DUF2236 family)
MMKLGFGDPETSREQAELLQRIHSKVRGTTADGVRYSALDVDLLLWVWATLVDGSMRMYELVVRAFEEGERDAYYEEQKLVAVACGIAMDRCPPTVADFHAYVTDTIANDLRVTDVARIVAFAGRHPPMPWPVAPVVGRLITLVTAGLLEPDLREALGYEWSPRAERRLRAFFAAQRAIARVTPSAVRHLPNRYLVRRTKPLKLFGGRAVDLPANLQR